MRFTVSLLLGILLIVIAGCASSSNKGQSQDSYPHLVETVQPEDQPYESSKVYIDSVKQITFEGEPALLVSGTFPDGCTNLREVSHTLGEEAVALNFVAWRNPEKMCTQVLTPFSFIYKGLTENEINAYSSVTVKGVSYSF